MNYKKKYIKYKTKYLHAKNLSGGGKEKNIIFLTGCAASGKSTISQKYAKKGYTVINLDKIIRHKIIPKFKDNTIADYMFFKVYVSDDHIKTHQVAKAKIYFIKLVQKLIKKNKKSIVEGQIRDPNMIKKIFGTDLTFYPTVIRCILP